MFMLPADGMKCIKRARKACKGLESVKDAHNVIECLDKEPDALTRARDDSILIVFNDNILKKRL